MNKNLLRILFLCVAVLMSTKAFVALIAYQTVESIRDSYGDSVSVTYGWISSGFDGALTYEDVAITPYSLKRSFKASAIRVEFGHYFSLLAQLADLKSLSLEGIKRISVDGIQAPLEGRDIEQWLAEEYAPELSVPLGLYACGNVQRIGHEQLRSMGIQELKSRLNIGIAENAAQGPLSLSIDADLYEIGRIELDLGLGNISDAEGVAEWPLHHLRFKYVDNGYLRRLANLCESSTSFDRMSYAQSAALVWQKTMQQNGISVNDSILNAYFTYLSLGGAATLRLAPEQPFTLAQMLSDYDKNLFSAYGVTLSLNKVDIDAPGVRLLKAYFDPEPVQANELVESIETKEIELPRAVVLPVEELDGYLGRDLVVTLVSGKVYEGTLQSSDEFRFELVPEVSKGAGQVAYTVQREDVKEILLQQR